MNLAEPNSKKKYNEEKINNVKAGDFWFYKIKVYTSVFICSSNLLKGGWFSPSCS